MTRSRVVIAVVLVAVTGLAALRVRSHNSGDSMYHVDAVFDTARGLLPGGRVKIAGANVGVIEDIRLTPGRKALVEMRIDKRFAPFHTDAHCSSRPQGLVGVADVNCHPGTPAGRPLPQGQEGHPTLPLARTSVPVNLTDFFQIWHAPVRDRLRILLNQLGMSLSGRGDQLNALLRRANPALQKANRALAVIASQRRALAQSVTDSNRAIAELAADRPATRRFIAEGARTTRLMAAHERALGVGIAGLPPLLLRSKSALDTLDTLNRASLPLVDRLHAAAPGLDRLASDTVPFAKLALPSVRALTPALQQGNATAKVLGPFVNGLDGFTKYAVPAGRLQSDLQVDLRDSGAYDNLLRLFYDATSSISRYDAVGHLDPSHLVATPCAAYASKHDDLCDYHWVKQHDTATRRHARRATRHRRHTHRGAAAVPDAPARPPSGPAPAAPKPPGLPKLPPPPTPKLPSRPDLPPVPAPQAPEPPPLDPLLDYLLGS